jgi:hypothetical protein
MSDDRSEFDEHARKSRQSIFHEFGYFLRHNRKWWLTPIILVLILVSALVILGGTAAAPFIYTLF